MSVSSRAEGEASKKGLTGAAKRQYVGGAINRARHEKAESATPAAKAKKQEHSYHREALADARSQIRYHEAQIAGLREGMKQRRELASAKPSRHGKVKPEGSRIKLTPIQSIPGYQLDATRRLDPYDIRENFGAHQTPAALSIQTPRNLSGAVDVVQERTGRTYTGSRKSRQGMYDWILDNMDAPAAPRAAPATRPLAQPKPATPKRAPRPKKPPTLERQIAQAGGYVPKTPAAKLRKTPVREMTDEQLLRDWENHPPERRRGVLEREMARRQAKAAKAQQPKPAKTKRGEFSIPTPIRTDFPYEKSDPYKTPDMDHLADAYGRPQLRAAMANYSVETLRQIAGSYHERHPNAPMARGRSREQLLDGLLRQYDAAQRRRS